MCGKSSVESVWKRDGTLEKQVAGDWMKHLCVPSYTALSDPQSVAAEDVLLLTCSSLCGPTGLVMSLNWLVGQVQDVCL